MFSKAVCFFIFHYTQNLFIPITKTAHYISVYKAVLTVFMLYDYDKNIDIILKDLKSSAYFTFNVLV
jgi:hypothetical protein